MPALADLLARTAQPRPHLTPCRSSCLQGGPTGGGPPVSSRASSALRMQLDSEKLSSVVQAVKVTPAQPHLDEQL